MPWPAPGIWRSKLYVAPMDDPSIPKRVWDSWWELYNEQGRTHWPKRFDFTQFRVAEVHYYSDGDRGDMFRTVVMCYSARANPEDIKKETGFKVREVRGIRKNTFVRLKDSTAGGDAIPSALHARKLTRPEARRCHGRVVGFARVGGKRLVKLNAWAGARQGAFAHTFCDLNGVFERLRCAQHLRRHPPRCASGDAL